MIQLPLEDQRYLEGWCELRAFDEAAAELDNITTSLRPHPKLLEVRWQIYANLEKWAGALDIANAIVKMTGHGKTETNRLTMLARSEFMVIY